MQERALILILSTVLAGLTIASLTTGAATLWNKTEKNTQKIDNIVKIQLETVITLKGLITDNDDQERRLRALERSLGGKGLQTRN